MHKQQVCIISFHTYKAQLKPERPLQQLATVIT